MSSLSNFLEDLGAAGVQLVMYEYTDADADMWLQFDGKWCPLKLYWLQVVEPNEPPAIRQWRRDSWASGVYDVDYLFVHY